MNKDVRLNQFVSILREYSQLDEEVLKEMAAHIPIESFPKGSVLLRQGEVPSKCYFVLSGCARKYSVDEEGKEVTSEFYTEKESITIIPEEGQMDSLYSVECLEDSVMIVGLLDEEDKELETYPEFQTIVLKMMQSSMGRMQDSFASFISLTPEERVKHLLSKRQDLFTRVPQYQLASYLGLTPESFSRIKKRLRE